MQRGAKFSKDRSRRFVLWRIWNKTKPMMMWVMMNPSIAGETVDDHTIRKCIGFAKRWGFGGFFVVNRFALVSTKPEFLLSYALNETCELLLHDADNMYWIRHTVKRCEYAICAWGCESVSLRLQRQFGVQPDTIPNYIKFLKPSMKIECLGISPKGTPYHPVMLAYDLPRIPFPGV